jgi:hypothetical protein
MDNIYEDATITIIASISAGVDNGFLHHVPSKPDPVRLPLLLVKEKSLGMLNLYPCETKVFQEPLYSRGWALQELVLSQRALIFGEEVQWECESIGYLHSKHGRSTIFPSNTIYVLEGWADRPG